MNNPAKPAKWHLKHFEVSDTRTGYVIAFDVYTGKNRTRCTLNVDVFWAQILHKLQKSLLV